MMLPLMLLLMPRYFRRFSLFFDADADFLRHFCFDAAFADFSADAFAYSPRRFHAYYCFRCCDTFFFFSAVAAFSFAFALRFLHAFFSFSPVSPPPSRRLSTDYRFRVSASFTSATRGRRGAQRCVRRCAARACACEW